VVFFSVGVEVVHQTVLVDTCCTIGGRTFVVFAFVYDQVLEDAALIDLPLFDWSQPLLCLAGAVIEAIAIDVVKVDLVHISSVLVVEKPASSRSRVHQTGTSIVGFKVRVNKPMFNHKLHTIALDVPILVGHYAVAHKDAFEVDLLGLGLSVVEIYFAGQVGDVLPRVGLACKPEDVGREFGVLDEEV